MIRVMYRRGGVALAVVLSVAIVLALQQGGRLPGFGLSGTHAPGSVALVTARSEGPAPTRSIRPGATGPWGSSAQRRSEGPVARVVSVPTIAIASYQQVLINRDRAGSGLGALTWSSCLYSVAVANARRMAAQGYISHTSGPWVDLGCRLGAQAGENVGWWSGGVIDAQLNSMFMASPDHRANIMGPYHYVATAWAVAANGYAYIAVEFS